jgi:TolB-like protein
MKNILAFLVLGIALAGVSFAQGPARGQGVKTVVVEFTPGPNASAMNDQAKRGLQSMLSSRLHHTRKFNVYDTRHTRNASDANLEAINGASTAAAVKLGKQLGVAYVVTGRVVEYNTGGSATVAFRLIEVATGKVRHSGEISQTATMKMTGNAGAAEMQAKVMRPLIDKLTEALASKF